MISLSSILIFEINAAAFKRGNFTSDLLIRRGFIEKRGVSVYYKLGYNFRASSVFPFSDAEIKLLKGMRK